MSGATGEAASGPLGGWSSGGGSGGAGRISKVFAAAAAARRPLIIPFVTAGFPTATATVPIVHAMVEAGADIVEIGMPFSDPLADGPTIQRSSEVALRNGMTVRKTLAIVAELRAAGLSAPIVLMGYCNPIYAYGMQRFLTDAAGFGVDGLIVADLPPEEAGEYRAGCDTAGLSATFLVAPNASDERIRAVDAASSDFSYCVTVTGVTGARAEIATRTVEFMTRLRELSTKPFVVGFGIQTAEHVAALGAHADGVVVGSALIDVIETALGRHPDRYPVPGSPDAKAPADAERLADAEAPADAAPPADAETDRIAAAAVAARIAPLRAAAEGLAAGSVATDASASGPESDGSEENEGE